MEKPDRGIFQLAMAEAPVHHPEEMMHVGDSREKDYEPAKALGMQAALLDRFQTEEARRWRQEGLLVFRDLKEMQGHLLRHQMI